MAQNKVATLILKLKDLVTKGLKKSQTRFEKFTAAIGRAKFALLAIAVVAGLVGKALIGAADKMEQWQISFETMLGSAEKARILMEDIKKFAQETPFELPDVIKGAKGLLAFGIELEKVIPNLKSLGDVAAGLGVPIDRLILNFGQVKAQAKLTGRELRDFAIAGVPLLGELAKNLGVAESQIQDMVSKGEIGFPAVEAAFDSMSGAGGRFENLMERQMTTFTGVVSNAKDQVFQLSAELGENLLPSAKAIVKVFTAGVTAIREFNNALTALGEVNVEAGKTAESLLQIQQAELEVLNQAIETRIALNAEFGSSTQAIADLMAMMEKRKLLRTSIEINLKKSVANVKKIRAQEIKDEGKNQKIEVKQQLHTQKELDKIFDESLKLAKEREKERVDNMRDTLNTIATLQTAHNKGLALIGKAAAIAIATIDMHAGIMKAWAIGGPFGAPLAALVAAAGAVNIAKIAGVQLAEGGVVLPRAGGVQATLGEAGRPEAVIPLDDPEVSEQLGGALGGTTININVGTLVGSDGMTELASIIDAELFQLKEQGQTVSITKEL